MKYLYHKIMYWIVGFDRTNIRVRDYHINNYLKKINYEPTMGYLNKGDQNDT
jgi:hypothetical protein